MSLNPPTKDQFNFILPEGTFDGPLIDGLVSEWQVAFQSYQKAPAPSIKAYLEALSAVFFGGTSRAFANSALTHAWPKSPEETLEVLLVLDLLYKTGHATTDLAERLRQSMIGAGILIKGGDLTKPYQTVMQQIDSQQTNVEPIRFQDALTT